MAGSSFGTRAKMLYTITFLVTSTHCNGSLLLQRTRNLPFKFIYSEKAKKFCKISTLLMFYVVSVKIKVEILQNFVAFFEYMNFIYKNNLEVLSQSR